MKTGNSLIFTASMLILVVIEVECMLAPAPVASTIMKRSYLQRGSPQVDTGVFGWWKDDGPQFLSKSSEVYHSGSECSQCNPCKLCDPPKLAGRIEQTHVYGPGCTRCSRCSQCPSSPPKLSVSVVEQSAPASYLTAGYYGAVPYAPAGYYGSGYYGPGPSTYQISSFQGTAPAPYVPSGYYSVASAPYIPAGYYSSGYYGPGPSTYQISKFQSTAPAPYIPAGYYGVASAPYVPAGYYSSGYYGSGPSTYQISKFQSTAPAPFAPAAYYGVGSIPYLPAGYYGPGMPGNFGQSRVLRKWMSGYRGFGDFAPVRNYMTAERVEENIPKYDVEVYQANPCVPRIGPVPYQGSGYSRVTMKGGCDGSTQVVEKVAIAEPEVYQVNPCTGVVGYDSVKMSGCPYEKKGFIPPFFNRA